MAVNLSPVGGVAAQFFDNSGQVLTGGLLYTYAAGTTTPAITYTSSTGLTAHTNPIVLDAAGRVSNGGEIWLTDGVSYKFILQDQFAVQIATYDNIVGINSNFIAYTGQTETQTATQGQTVFTLTTIQYQPGVNNLAIYVNGSKQVADVNYQETTTTTVTFVDGLNVGDVVEFNTASPIATNTMSASNVSFTGANGTAGNVQDIANPDGSDWIGYNQGGTGAVDSTVQTKLQEYISVKDFGTVGDGVTDDGAAIQAAIDYCNLANPIGTSPTQGYARATLWFPPGVYLTKQTLTFGAFTNYVGTRATTASTVASTANQIDSRGSIIRADVSIYNASTNPTGCLGYIPTGDITFKDLTFVGTAAINGNSSTGLQFGSHGGVSATSRSYETDGTGQNCSGVALEYCTFYTFSTAWECNSINDAFMYQCRWESNTTNINFSENISVSFDQSAEFTSSSMFGHNTGVSFAGGPQYIVSFIGGNFYGTANGTSHVAYTSSGANLILKFTGVDFTHTGTNSYHFFFSGNYDGAFNEVLVSNCSFNGNTTGRAVLLFQRTSGTAGFAHAIFSSCALLGTYFNFGLATNNCQIKDSYFNESHVILNAANSIDVVGNEFLGYNGVGIEVLTASSQNSSFRNNRFTNVTTPISIFNNSTNDTIVTQDNFGVTTAPTRGKWLDFVNNITFANLGTPANGSMVYCADGTIASPVAGSGTGCIAKRLNGVWVGN
jgi:hypothetical protein